MWKTNKTNLEKTRDGEYTDGTKWLRIKYIWEIGEADKNTEKSMVYITDSKETLFKC